MGLGAVKVHGLPRSSATQRVLAALNEKNVEYEFVFVNLMKGEQKLPSFLELQPFGVVPVLQDGDFTLYESRAIAWYVAEKNEDAETSLYGTTLADKALTRQWLEVESQNFTPALQPIFYQLFVCPMRGLPVDLSVVEANLPKFAKVLDIYEERLGKTPYLAGEFFSLADLSHLPFLQNIVPKPELAHLFQSRKNVWAWWERISERPAWKKVVAFANA